MVVRGLPKAETRVRFPYTAPELFMIQTYAGQLAAVFSILAYLTYIIAALKGKNRPSRASWFIWTVVGFIIATSYYYSGATTTLWVPVSNCIGQLVIFLLALKYGTKGWSSFDTLCITGALGGLALWGIFNTPLVALLANIFVDFMGALPTIKKTWKKPQEENCLSWLLFTLTNGTNILALNTWDFGVVILPVYLFAVSLTVTVLIFRQKN